MFTSRQALSSTRLPDAPATIVDVGGYDCQEQEGWRPVGGRWSKLRLRTIDHRQQTPREAVGSLAEMCRC
jgi:hypothetical protein